MESIGRGRAVVFVIPMIVGIVAARAAERHVRLGDFLLLFAAGAVFGVSLMGLVSLLRGRGRSTARDPSAIHSEEGRR